MTGIFLMLAAGLGAGVAAGLGIGGGALLIPVLTMFLGMDQRTAQGINLIYFIPTGIIAVITHVKNRKIDKELVKGLVFYGLLAAVAGSFIALSIQQETLRKMFGYFLLLVGVHELVAKANNKGTDISKE